MAARLDQIFDRVGALLAAPAHGAEAPSRARIESILTEGYAEALALDGERLRITREIDGLTAELVRGGGAHPETLRDLVDRLKATETDLAELRELLLALRGRVARAA